MSESDLLLLYALGSLALIGALALGTEWRRRTIRPAPSNDNVFWCRQCGYVYTDDPDVDRSRCPQCGQFNDPVSF
ncbi:MAG: hypothetical protein J7M29_06675 [Verrucomicrobia bacterium]|nr:hypothetical protein [Verrucomicrobiota bacterium]